MQNQNNFLIKGKATLLNIEENILNKIKENKKINLLSNITNNLIEDKKNISKIDKLKININDLQISQTFNIISSLSNKILKLEKSTQIPEDNQNKNLDKNQTILSLENHESFILNGIKINALNLNNQINENKIKNPTNKYENFKVENDLKVSIEYREIDKYILDVIFKTTKEQNLILHWGICKNKNWFHPRKEWLPPNSRIYDEFSIDTPFMINKEKNNEKIIHIHITKGKGHSKIDGLSFVFYNPNINKWYNNSHQDYQIKFNQLL